MQNSTTRPRLRQVQGSQTGVYKADAIKVRNTELSRQITYHRTKDIAESLNLTLSDTVASSLASDVEHRINQVIEVRSFLYQWLYFSYMSRKQPGS
jgi:transcription initiation factor TFIID subunit 6